MKKIKFVESISQELPFNDDEKKALYEFCKSNSALIDKDFYPKLLEAYPVINLYFKYNQALKLKSIENHLFFFKMLTIIFLILGIIIYFGLKIVLK